LGVSGDGSAPSATTFHDEAYFHDELDIDLLLGEPATSLDTTNSEVHVGSTVLGYDHLVIATGARARAVPDVGRLAGVHVLRGLDDAVAIREAIDHRARTVVIGAGFIGSELAASARKRGCDVTIIEALPTPLARAVGAENGDALAGLHARNGTTLRCGVTVEAMRGSGAVEEVELSDGTSVAADLVVVGIGAAPNTEWLEGSALRLDDGVVCDATLWTGTPNIYAAGDVARWHNPQFDRLQRLEHWTSAAEQGAAAARNALLPSAASAYSTVPYFWSDWYDTRIQFVGIPQADEVRVVDGDPGTSERWVTLYRSEDQLVGALAVNGQSVIMKYRAMIAKRTTWRDALDFAAARSLIAAARHSQ
jgi:NADPH-dependent 2,4-dienoyl-CoA reductase/sulfur reductase-like enzyme